jgi:hypothetical protein
MPGGRNDANSAAAQRIALSCGRAAHRLKVALHAGAPGSFNAWLAGSLKGENPAAHGLWEVDEDKL